MNLPNARERILEAAVRVFAEKSFEGSRIDEIARTANVPKSLIYYHFKSKDEIFEVLTDKFIREYLDLIDAVPVESNKEKAENLPARMKSSYYEFGRRNADLARAIFIDSLKKTKEQPVLYRVLDAMIRKDEEKSPGGYDIQERRVAEFFTSFIPNFAYVCFADSWTNYFNIEKKKFDALYLKVYEESHGAYHKNHDREP
jgi:AcrR family transcriptional regulator